MDASRSRRGSLVAGGLLLVGGLTTILGTFLPWFDVSTASASATIAGASLGIGWISFLAALIAVGAGFALLYYAGWHSLAWSVIGIVIGALVVFLGVRLLADPDQMLLDRAVEDVATFYGQDVAATTAEVQAGLADGSLEASAGSGAWVLVVGGALAAAGGIAGATVWATRRRHWTAPA